MIYRRQKFLLAILLESPKELTITELTGISAIISQNSKHFKTQPPYDLIATDKPKSLQLLKDVQQLKIKELLTLNAQTITNNLSIKAKNIAFELSFEELKDIKLITQNHFSTSPKKRELAIASVIPKHKTKKATPSIFTVGYEGESVDHFFNKILSSGIKAIIDIRNNPISRKYGFSKKIMAQLLKESGVDYFHFPELGIPSSLRKNLKSDTDYRRLLDEYEQTVLPKTEAVQTHVLELLKSKPSALLCFEADQDSCHRSRLAKSLEKMGGLSILHI